MEPFIFHCRNNGKDGFIRLGLTFRMSNEEALAEARENTPLLRRSVTFYMKTRDVNELLSERTRRKILEEIRGNIDKSLKDGRATAVFADEFVVY
ncbi:MAG: flagellar basal body-associated FliL family protein, partial [Nitrospinae bacterium]|nr:flagellar basal body-associated FliL family protein [Nitrospinota bacterium]